MADERLVEILQQGVSSWNYWRREQEKAISGIYQFDLREANLGGAVLYGADLRGVDLSYANLRRADLRKVGLIIANLRRADLREADLGYANLAKADLSQAMLHETNLSNGDLKGANLSMASLRGANLSGADLREANLSSTDLNGADLRKANLIGADFQGVLCGNTSFSNVGLSVVKNLELVHHHGPSSIDIDTLYLSNGNIPREFLEGCGVPEGMITFMKSLVGKAIEYYSCFISYSTQDEDFARQLNARLKDNGLRVWFAPEEMKGGQKIHEQLYEGIRLHDKLILVLSEASMNSTWVQTEIKRARKHERDEKRRKLFPISLVPFEQIKAWELFDGDEGRDLAQEIREYYIPDFSQWKDYDRFTAEFDKLLKALRADEGK